MATSSAIRPSLYRRRQARPVRTGPGLSTNSSTSATPAACGEDSNRSGEWLCSRFVLQGRHSVVWGLASRRAAGIGWPQSSQMPYVPASRLCSACRTSSSAPSSTVSRVSPSSCATIASDASSTETAWPGVCSWTTSCSSVAVWRRSRLSSCRSSLRTSEWFLSKRMLPSRNPRYQRTTAIRPLGNANSGLVSCGHRVMSKGS